MVVIFISGIDFLEKFSIILVRGQVISNTFKCYFEEVTIKVNQYPTFQKYIITVILLKT